MSLYDESIEIVEYQTMLRDIERNRELIDRRSTIDPLADRPDIVVDQNGDYWTLAPVTRNYGLPVPIFYRFEYVPTKGRTMETNRSQAARKIRHPNRRIVDREPKRSKAKR